MEDGSSTNLAPTLPPGLPDDWFFERDVECPTCRYNLRMLRLPRCPECGTVFRWQTLLQVTCPRCGQSLDGVDADRCPACKLELNWPRLLNEANLEKRGLFEYTRRPIRAGLRTWAAVLRPRRFWSQIPIESPPAVWRLRWLRRCAVGFVVLAVAVAFFTNRSYWPRLTFDAGWRAFCAAVLLPPFVAMIGIPLFTPTLTRFRIRRNQLLRCSAYGCSGLVWIGCAFLLVSIATLVVNTFWPRGILAGGGGTFQTPRLRLLVSPMLILDVVRNPWVLSRYSASECVSSFLIAAGLYFSVIWWWRYLWVALSGYLQLDRRNAVALFASTQAIALLAVAIILIRFTELGLALGFLINKL